MLWDIFCRVIDNFGDIGVSWRLCADLAARGERVRLWVDDTHALHWMAPGAVQGHCKGIEVRHWSQCSLSDTLSDLTPADVWMETFGCEIPEPFIAHRVHQRANAQAGQPVWVNLEYLSGEPYVERCHGLPSPVMHGPARGWTKHFFYPGFSAQTGSLLRETDLMERRRQHDEAARKAWLAQHGVAATAEAELLISLFCYEPPLLAGLLAHLASCATPVRLLVTPGRAAQAVRAILGGQPGHGALRLHYLNPLPQSDFDTLLWSCDVNFVRGEDSLVRALWAGKPFVWHIYPQHDLAHAAKLDAFLEHMQWSAAVRGLQRTWNGLVPAEQASDALALLASAELPAWEAEVRAARTRLLELADLVSQLCQFVAKSR